MKVYLVQRYVYDDTLTLAVFSDEATAERYCKLAGASVVEHWIVDDPEAMRRLDAGKWTWTVLLYDGGADGTKLTRTDHAFKTDFWHPGQMRGVSGGFYGRVVARDRDEAIRKGWEEVNQKELSAKEGFLGMIRDMSMSLELLDPRDTPLGTAIDQKKIEWGMGNPGEVDS